MKNEKQKIMVLMLIAVLSMASLVVITDPAAADDASYYDHIATNNNTEVQITGYHGPGGDITIPTSFDGKPVTSLGNGSFPVSIGNGITSVIIPDTVRSIGSNAFFRSPLTSITIPDSVTSIGSMAFSSCELNSVTIPRNVASIGNEAFSNNPLVSISVDVNNRYFASSADGLLYDKTMTDLIQCPGGRQGAVTIQPGAVAIGPYAFYMCDQTTTVSIPDTVTSIGNYAFQYCSALASVSMPNSVTTIGDSAFEYCAALTNVTLPASVTKIGGNAFHSSGLSSVTMTNVSTIGSYAFFVTPLTSVTIPDSVRSIGDYAFSQCPDLTAVKIGSGVTSIGTSAFSACPALTSITFSGLVTPTTVGANWVQGANAGLQGHAYKASNFPNPGKNYTGLLMGPVYTSAPLTPTGLSVVGGNLKATLTWKAPTFNGGVNIDHYVVYQNGAPLIGQPTATSVTLTGLTNGHTYSFAVAAHNSAGTSKPTAAFTVTLPSPLNITVISPLADSFYNTRSVLVKWTANEVMTNCSISVDHGVGVNVTKLSSYQFTALSEGRHTMALTGWDSKGNEANAQVGITVDTIAPTLTINPPSNGNSDPAGGVTVTWSMGDSGSGIARTEVSIDGAAWTTVNGASDPVTGLYVGDHTASVRVTDRAGNNVTGSVPFSIVGPGPVITIKVPADGSFIGSSSGSVIWSGKDTLGAISYYNVSIDGMAPNQVSGSTTSYPFSGLADGAHFIVIEALDSLGNDRKATAHFTVDTVKPDLIIVAPMEKARFNTSTIDISWIGSDAFPVSNYWVRMDSSNWMSLEPDVTTTQFASLADGSHVLTVKAQDKAGNVNQTAVDIVVDTLTPSLTAHAPVGIAQSQSASISVSFSEGMDRRSVMMSLNGINGTTSWNGNNATFHPASDLAPGAAYRVEVSGKDLAGNPMQYSWSFSTSKGDGVIDGVVRDKSGNRIADAKVTLSNGMATVTDANGSFVFDNVSAGTYDLTVTKDGYLLTTQSISAADGQMTDLGMVSLQSSSGSSSDSVPIIAGMAVITVAVLAGLFFLRKRGNR